MATVFDPNFRTTQEYLNNKAGFTGPLRTKQECLQSLSKRPSPTNTVITMQDAAMSWSGVPNSDRTVQGALNRNASQTNDNTVTLQEAIRRTQ